MRKLVGCTVFGALILAASAASAKPNYTTKVLVRAPSVGRCSATFAKPSGTRLVVIGHPFDSKFSCGIDTIKVPIDDISTASVYLYANSSPQEDVVPWARLCYRSLFEKSERTCGPTAYGQLTSGVQKITAVAPSGSFEDEPHMAIVQVLVPKAVKDYNYFYGFELNKITVNSPY